MKLTFNYKNLKYYLCLIFIISFIIGTYFFGIYSFNRINNENSRIYEENINVPKNSIHEEWNQTYGVNPRSSIASSLICDSEGKIYVTGSICYYSSDNKDLVLRKFHDNGTLIWERIVDGDGINTDRGNDIALDSNENIYIAGQIYNTSGYTDLLVLKYNSSGVLQWKYNWTGIDTAVGSSIAIDKNDNVYVLGVDRRGALKDNFLLLRMNHSTGEKIWERFYNTTSFALYVGGVCTDSNGMIFISGYNVSTSSDIQIAKYDSDGNQQWNDSRSINAHDYATGIAVNSSDHIFISGISTGGQSHAALYSYANDGTYQGIQYPMGTFEESAAYGIFIDNSTNKIYLTGYNSSSADPEKKNVLISVFDKNGVNEWNFTQDYYDLNDMGMDLYFDGNQSIYIAGYISNDTFTQQFALMKFSFVPGSFTISSNPSGVITTGNFDIVWNQADSANNYTIYNYTSYITEINSSLNIQPGGEEISYGSPFAISGLEDGDYYYIIEAHNEYGNSTSNCLHVEVVRTPGAFTIECNATQPYDNDGIFTLNWSTSQYAENYTIRYRAGDDDPTLLLGNTYKNVSSDITSVLFNVTGASNGNYTLKIWATNIGEGAIEFIESSNTVTITLGLPPGTQESYTVSSPDAGDPDTDKEFRLNYGSSGDQADYYEVYYSTTVPSGIHYSSLNVAALNDMTLLYNGTNKFYFVTEADALPDGVIYFLVIAYNDYGNYTPAYFSLNLGEPSEPDDGWPWWVYPILTGIISAVVGIAIKQSYNTVKKRRIFMQNVTDKFEQVDNIELFLKENLKYEEWQKLQEPLDKYKKHQISNKELIKQGKKELGKDFTDLLMGKKKPKS